MEWLLYFGILVIGTSLIGLIALGIFWRKRNSRKLASSRALPGHSSPASLEAETTTSRAGSTQPIRASSAAATPEPLHPVEAALEPDDVGSLEAKRILTKQEAAFFWMLFKTIGTAYYIFPQIPIKALAPSFENRIPYNLKGMWWDGLVDFILADINTLEVVAGIELDDSSHHQADAQARDQRKDQLLDDIGLPRVRISGGETWDPKVIQSRLKQVTQGRPFGFLTTQEAAIFRALRQARNDWFIFPKASLSQMIKRTRWLPIDAYKALQAETADFLIAHPKYLGPLVVVEHEEGLSVSLEKHELLVQARIPCITVASASLNPQKLREEIERAIPKQVK